MTGSTESAVVVGGSIAGMLAARAVSDRYRRVVVVERDRLPDGPRSRRGVPQGRQLHVLLARGLQAMDELFPGLLTELTAAGAIPYDAQAEATWYMDGRRLASAPSGITGYGLSRPLLDHLIRTRTAALPNVEIIQETEVKALVETSGAVTGIVVGATRSADRPDRSLGADLVIDASGRGSRSLTWLEELGYAKPPQTRVDPGVVYVTRRYKAGPGTSAKPPRAVVVPHPGNPRGGAVAHEENDRIALVLFGVLGTNPPTDDAGMLAYAESLGSDEIVSLVRTGTPLGEPVKMRYPASVRQHPERAKTRPDGFLLLGDSLASFNPTYGQGITTAALQAHLLNTQLAESSDRVPALFYPRAAKIIDSAWDTAVGGDLRFPEVIGPRPPLSGLVNRYMDRFRAAAATDPRLGRNLLEVANMLAPTSTLLSPKSILRVLAART